MPITCPRGFGGNEETKIACPVVLVKAAPTPCKNLETMSHNPVGAIALVIEERVKITTPILNSFATPELSPHLPEGRRNIAVESRKEVMTQLSMMALISNVFSIAGRAILMEEIKNDPIKEVIATIRSIETCLRVHLINSK